MTGPPWMQTYTGQRFDPLHPDPAAICIEDIAHALSMNCRYAGHVRRFYSVAEHSVHVSQAVSPQNALWGLLHDAAEAYIGDLVRPLKHQLPEYRRVEDDLLAVICAKFGLPTPMPAEVSNVDLRVVVDEKAKLLGPEPEPWQMIADVQPLNIRIHAWNPHQAEYAFLREFYEVGREQAEGAAK